MNHRAAIAPTAQTKPRWPLYLALGIALIAWCALDVQRRGRIDPARPHLHRTDFTAYTEASAAFFDGRDPYEVTNSRGWGYCYPPLFALLVAPLAPLDPRVQVSIWFFISVAVVWGIYRESVRLLQFCAPLAGYDLQDSQPPRWIAAAGIAVTVLPVLNCLQRGQVDVLKLYLLLAGIRLAITGTAWRAWFVGGVALVASIVLKVTPLLPVGFVMFMLAGRMWNRADRPAAARRLFGVGTGAVCGAAALLLFVPAAIVGWQANLGYLERFYQDKLVKANDHFDADKTGNTRTLRNQSFSNAVIRLGDFIGYQFLGGPDDRLIDSEWRECPPMVMDAPGVSRVLLVARVAALALLLAAGALAIVRNDLLAQAATIALACTAALVVSPISRGFYHTELVPAVLLVPLWLLSRGMPSAAKAMAWIPVALVMAHYLALPIAGRIGLLGLGTACWYATATLLVAIGGRVGSATPHEEQSSALRRPVLHRHGVRADSQTLPA